MTDLIAIQRIAGWDKLKTMVLDSVSSPITKRVYNMALDEFLAWFQDAPRPGFTKATVSAWRVSLEERRLGSSSIIIRMSAIRKLAAAAAGAGSFERARYFDALRATGPGDPNRASRLRLATVRSGRAEIRASP